MLVVLDSARRALQQMPKPQRRVIVRLLRAIEREPMAGKLTHISVAESGDRRRGGVEHWQVIYGFAQGVVTVRYILWLPPL